MKPENTSIPKPHDTSVEAAGATASARAVSRGKPAVSKAENIFSEQVRLLYAGVPVASATNLLSAAFLAFVQLDATSATVIMAWGAYLVVTVALRVAVARRFTRLTPAPTAMRLWSGLFVGCMALIGSAWGLAAILFLSVDSPAHQLITALILIGFVAGAVPSLSSVFAAYVFFSVPIAIPAVMQFLIQGDKISVSTGILTGMLIVFLLSAARRQNRSVVASLSLRFENEDLVNRLRKEKNVTDGLNAGLKQEIEARERIERDLVQAKDVAESASLAKSEFLSRMSHELRTPMNAILGFGQLLQADPEEPLRPNQGEAVNEILKAGAHLLELINEVLDLAGVESGEVTLTIESVDLGNVIKSCLTLAKPLADEQKIALVNRAAGKDLARVSADATRFRQALLNLVSNAVKYNHDGGAVTIDAEETDDGMVRISVADTGPGIAIEKQDQLFEPFNRLGMKDGTIEGSGIGLTITKQLVELMMGRIGFESSLGKGSNFWIDLPMAAAAS